MRLMVNVMPLGTSDSAMCNVVVVFTVKFDGGSEVDPGNISSSPHSVVFSVEKVRTPTLTEISQGVK